MYGVIFLSVYYNRLYQMTCTLSFKNVRQISPYERRRRCRKRCRKQGRKNANRLARCELKKEKKTRKSDGNMIQCLLNESSHAGRDNDWPSVGHSVRISPRSARTS